MKRRNALALLVSLVFIVGCVLLGCSAGSAVPKPVTDGFSCSVTVSSPELSLAGTLTRGDDRTLSLALSEPETLRGLTLTWNGETVSASLGAIQIDLSAFDLPDAAIGNCLTAVLDALEDGGGSRTDEGWKITGSTEQGEFEALIDPDSGQLISLSIPELGLEAQFSDMNVIEE